MQAVCSLQFAVGRKPKTINLKTNIELLLASAAPSDDRISPKGGAKTLEEKSLTSWFPLWRKRWCGAPKGHAKRKWIVLV